MIPATTPFKLVEVIEERRHVVRVEGTLSNYEAEEKAKNGEGEITSPYPPEVTSVKVIGGSDEDEAHSDE